MTEGSPEQFVADIAAFTRNTKESMDKAYRKITLSVLRDVVLATPVDKGGARGGWQVAIGAMPSQDVDRKDRSGRLALQDGGNAIGGLKAGMDLYIVNRIPYIRVLEYGLYPNPPAKGTYVPRGKSRYGITGPGYAKRSERGFSRQAPQGMVRVTIQRTRANIQNIVGTV